MRVNHMKLISRHFFHKMWLFQKFNLIVYSHMILAYTLAVLELIYFAHSPPSSHPERQAGWSLLVSKSWNIVSFVRHSEISLALENAETLSIHNLK